MTIFLVEALKKYEFSQQYLINIQPCLNQCRNHIGLSELGKCWKWKLNYISAISIIRLQAVRSFVTVHCQWEDAGNDDRLSFRFTIQTHLCTCITVCLFVVGHVSVFALLWYLGKRSGNECYALQACSKRVIYQFVCCSILVTVLKD